MRTLALIAIALGVGSIAVYMTTLSVPPPPAPVHPIVGKWRMETFCGRSSLEESGTNVCEFSADGSYVVINTHSMNDTERVAGNYEINNDIITIVCDLDQSHNATTRRKTSHIKFAESGNRLAITSDSNCGSETWVRVEK